MPESRAARSLLGIGALALLFVATPAETQLARKWFGTPKIVAVLVDLSASVSESDRQVYMGTFERLLRVVVSNDRVVLVPITDRSLSEFIAKTDVVLPEDGGSLKDKERLRHARSDLSAAFLKQLDGAHSKKTYLLDGLNVCQQLFESDSLHKERWIVVLSDMLEDSDYGDFEKIKLTGQTVNKIIERRKAAGSLPRLEGVRVWVAGARAKDAAKFNEVKEFWVRYLREAGARLEAGAYVRDGLQFPEPRRLLDGK